MRIKMFKSMKVVESFNDKGEIIDQKIEVLKKIGVGVSVIDKNAKHKAGYIFGSMKDMYN